MEKLLNEIRVEYICENYQMNMTYPGQKHFDCGNPIINRYVRSSLKSNVANGNCVSKALIDAQTGELLGVCSFTGYSLAKSRLSGVLTGSMPSDLSVVRLIMLGVSVKHQKQGYGHILMKEFLDHAIKVHHVMSLKGIFLDADPDAFAFYTLLGFVELGVPASNGTTPMFLKIQDLLAVVK
ncbi:GNAT family N-acetyltransferase [Xenorhabdus szentirmaii]|uniref:Acetyltransferase, GNAT family n=1 Tax=Xenorhabdus szentirmaii DSM 16338 TaxID=1427518 RepID=W1J3E6_9GAMM|nr:GNAT family N-acetyltransferase [Xenorhabdus szentirmaii]PHM34452.1 acetyltransferase [Xenorhabdus szentirmaii DSM 16338]PHM43181.1 acetyltransferase [Xenorhabdus szentirmaii]CDL83960.1 Acetyltransferase, GNAT family [Xenorhabdus szentirmaii DSM 16338]